MLHSCAKVEEVVAQFAKSVNGNINALMASAVGYITSWISYISFNDIKQPHNLSKMYVSQEVTKHVEYKIEDI